LNKIIIQGYPKLHGYCLSLLKSALIRIEFQATLWHSFDLIKYVSNNHIIIQQN